MVMRNAKFHLQFHEFSAGGLFLEKKKNNDLCATFLGQSPTRQQSVLHFHKIFKNIIILLLQLL